MMKSLINPNQCRAYGVPVCDDPTDPYRTLGFQLENYNIPFNMIGSTAAFSTSCPTPEEMDTCPKIFMSDPEYWDPANVKFNISTLEMGTKETYQHQSEYDIAMLSISSGYRQDLIHERMIDNVNVKMPVITSEVKKLAPMPKPKIHDFGTSSFT